MKKLCIVGSGLYGLTVARLAAEAGVSVTVVEKRNHPGGNSWSEVDSNTGIEFHTYGTHLFHTSNERVWSFVNRFSDFNSYKHRVFTLHKGRLFQMPPTLQEISWFFPGATSPALAKAAIEKDSLKEYGTQDNLEQRAISLVGEKIYRALIAGYTEKQWQTPPSELPASVITRLPFRLSFEGGYFKDKYQGIPKNGYGSLVLSMLDHKNIHLELDTDFIPNRDKYSDAFVVYTGALDRFFNYKFGRLGWRTLEFEYETQDTSDYQGTSVVNYADLDQPWTRIHEFRHLHPEREYGPLSLIAKEYSRVAMESDEPYYPVRSAADIALANKYESAVSKLPGVHVGGRLGKYRYFDMHQAIGSAMTDWDSTIREAVIGS